MVFVVRVRLASGVKRILLQDDNKTVKDMMLQIQDLTGIPIARQLLSRNPLSNPDFLTVDLSTSVKAAGIKVGDMFHLKDTSSSGSGAAAVVPSKAVIKEAAPSRPLTARTFKLTSKCLHGPKGRCLECAPVEEDLAKMSDENQGKITALCQHGPGSACLHCSKHVTDKDAEVAEWLCNHADSVFCPNCIPPEELGANGKPLPMACACDNSRGQSCIRCQAVEDGAVIKTDKIPYNQFLAERRALCKYGHPPSATCAYCSDPPFPSYAGNPKCKEGHKPYPFGVCLKCAPPNVHVRDQVYRHVDIASVPENIIVEFYQRWMRGNNKVQKAAILFGNVVDEPNTTNMKGGVRVQAAALYEPLQECKANGIRLKRDPSQEACHRVADALGMKPIGLVLATLPRSGKKYKGKVLLSGDEIKMAAFLQNRYKEANGTSKFVTIVVEHSAMVEPVAYQVSDQCVAMERDGLFGNSDDPNTMTIRKPKEKEMLPSVFYMNKELPGGAEFNPDKFIVKVIVAKPRKLKDIKTFKHSTFPANGSVGDLRAHFSRYGKEEYVEKLSDFNLLVRLYDLFGPELTLSVCKAIRSGKSFDKHTRETLDTKCMQHKLF